MTDPSKPLDQDRSVELETLISAIGGADVETLLELRQFLLGAMFPSMPDSVRRIMLPLFALVTLEARSIEHGLPRLVYERG
jgi:hypothetical protein